MELYKYWERIIEGWQVKIVFSICFSWLFGEYNAGMGALACLIVVDRVTKWGVISKELGGFWIAWKKDAIKRSILREGIKKIIGYMIALIAAHQLEQFSIHGYTVGRSSTEIVSAWLAVVEAKSILENLRDVGIDVGPLITMLGNKQSQMKEGDHTSNKKQ